MSLLRITRLGIILITLIMAASACWAQERLLQLNFKEGDTYQYQVSLEIEVMGETIPGGKTNIQEEILQTRKVQKVHPDGSADILFTHTDYELRQNKEVVSSAANDGLSFIGFPVDVPVLIRMSKQGSYMDIRPAKELRPSQRARAEAVFQNLKSLSLDFPESPVKVSESWVRQILTTSEGHGVGTIDIALDVTFTFAGIETFRGVKCAKITASGSANCIFEGGAGTMVVTTSSTILLDLENGREMKSTERGDYHIVLVTEEGEREMRQTMTQTAILRK